MRNLRKRLLILVLICGVVAISASLTYATWTANISFSAIGAGGLAGDVFHYDGYYAAAVTLTGSPQSGTIKAQGLYGSDALGVSKGQAAPTGNSASHSNDITVDYSSSSSEDSDLTVRWVIMQKMAGSLAITTRDGSYFSGTWIAELNELTVMNGDTAVVDGEDLSPAVGPPGAPATRGVLSGESGPTNPAPATDDVNGGVFPEYYTPVAGTEVGDWGDDPETVSGGDSFSVELKIGTQSGFGGTNPTVESQFTVLEVLRLDAAVGTSTL